MPEENREIFYSAAINEALDTALALDSDVVLIGEDIGVYGGAFGVTRGLLEKYGEKRVWETPISENSFVGAAVGAAMLGLKPVVEIMFMDFLALALDQLLNSAAKIHYMYSSQTSVPMVLRTPGGAKGGYGPSHSQMLTGMLLGIPGLKIVAPSNPADAKSLLLAAIADPNPVVFIENKRLYANRGFVPLENTAMDINRAKIVAPGKHASLIGYSATIPMCLQVRQAFLKRGIELEVVDLISLQPLDTSTIFNSVRRTGRVLLTEEACLTGGVMAEVAALIAENCIAELEAPILRVACADLPIPASPQLEQQILPTPEKIAAATLKLLDW